MIGSWWMSFFIILSRIMKFVALRSSSMSSTRAPQSTASMMFAACEVEPDAWEVEKSIVSPPGIQRMNGEMFR